MKALTTTDFHFDGQTSVYHGKVRDVYDINGDLLVMVATDRISAFDVILPKGIPFKGQVLNQIAAKFLDATADICPNWKLATPDPMVTVGLCARFVAFDCPTECAKTSVSPNPSSRRRRRPTRGTT